MRCFYGRLLHGLFSAYCLVNLEMKLFGISLSTPSNESLPFVGAALFISAVLGATLVRHGFIAVEDGVAITCGFVGAPLAWAYGASLKRDGFRAFVVGGVFALALFGMVRVLGLAQGDNPAEVVAQESMLQPITPAEAWAALDGPAVDAGAEGSSAPI